MERLQRVLATGVLEALRTREHVLVSPASSDALCDEVEAIIAPAIEDLTQHLTPPRRPRAKKRADAVESVVDRITARLLESDHVDDIFASDRTIRRDAYRAIRDILLGYIHGEIEVAEAARDDFRVQLASLGYLVQLVSSRVAFEVLCQALERAATSVGAHLVCVDTATATATFDLPGGAEVGRLAIEEAISEELVSLIEAEMIELPHVEQVLELDPHTSAAPGFAEAIARAEARTRSETGCAATCQLVDERTLIATLVPLSNDGVDRSEELFSRFVATLEEELSAVPGSEAPPPTDKPESGRRQSARKKVKSAAASEPVDGPPPKSRPVPSRRAPKARAEGRAPAGRASRTRTTTGDKRKKKRRAK